jgi:tetratricopeptide (TPR) repeat protein
VASYQGQMKKAAELTEELFRRADAMTRHAHGEAVLGLAIAQAMTGRHDVARAQLEGVRTRNLMREGATDEIVVLGAMLGDTALVQAHLQRAINHLQKVNPPEFDDKSEKGMRAFAALAAGRNQEAYDFASAVAMDPDQRNTMFVAGVAALRLQRWEDATKLFSALVGYRNKLGLSPARATCNIMLGRAHAGAGRAGDARSAYEEAFKIWKDADADMPLLVEARREYARLAS